MENHDKAGSEIHGLILLERQLRNNVVYNMKETVKQGAVLKEEVPEVAVNGENCRELYEKYNYLLPTTER